MKRLALMMPGQGSQFVGMGSDLVAADTRARELFEEADEILGIRLGTLCAEGPEEELRRTENAQPAILVHSIVCWTLMPESVRSRVVAAAGHSLGEFSAHVAAGTLPFADALRLVRRRGELMAASGDARPGTMAAVLGLDPETALEACQTASNSSGVVVPANFNAPGQIVISGDTAAVHAAMEAAERLGARKVIPLNVSGAFHSPLMGPARDGLAEAIESTGFADPVFPVVANASAAPVAVGEEAADQLVAQLTSPVRWVESMEEVRTHRPQLWIELGPGRVLSGLLKRIDRSQPSISVGSPGDIEKLVEVIDG